MCGWKCNIRCCGANSSYRYCLIIQLHSVTCVCHAVRASIGIPQTPYHWLAYLQQLAYIYCVEIKAVRFAISCPLKPILLLFNVGLWQSTYRLASIIVSKLYCGKRFDGCFANMETFLVRVAYRLRVVLVFYLLCLIWRKQTRMTCQNHA